MAGLVHVFGYYSFEANVLGWILENSPSYRTHNFRRRLENLNDPHNDPWDNHALDDLGEEHWTLEWTKHQEAGDFESLNKMMRRFPLDTGVFGVGYAGWGSGEKWITPATRILINPTQRLFDYYWKCYAERPITNIKHSMDMHILDHHQNDPEYKNYIYDTFVDYLKEDSVPFWKLQTAYHWGWKTCATDDDLAKAKQIALDEAISNVYEPDITVDLFELDIIDLCSKLECTYINSNGIDSMEREYNVFINYCEKVLKI